MIGLGCPANHPVQETNGVRRSQLPAHLLPKHFSDKKKDRKLRIKTPKTFKKNISLLSKQQLVNCHSPAKLSYLIFVFTTANPNILPNNNSQRAMLVCVFYSSVVSCVFRFIIQKEKVQQANSEEIFFCFYALKMFF
jgi:hypothetical protein